MRVCRVVDGGQSTPFATLITRSPFRGVRVVTWLQDSSVGLYAEKFRGITGTACSSPFSSGTEGVRFYHRLEIRKSETISTN